MEARLYLSRLGVMLADAVFNRSKGAKVDDLDLGVTPNDNGNDLSSATSTSLSKVIIEGSSPSMPVSPVEPGTLDQEAGISRTQKEGRENGHNQGSETEAKLGDEADDHELALKSLKKKGFGSPKIRRKLKPSTAISEASQAKRN